jgi:hypothetical protein
MRIEQIILEAMNTRLNEYVTANPIDVAWSGIPLDPVGKYLRPNLLPTPTVTAGVGEGSRNLLSGIYQVDVFWPENEGESLPYGIAGDIIAYFKRGTQLTYDGQVIKISGPPWVAPKVPNEDKVLQIPVSIPYWADAPNPEV